MSREESSDCESSCLSLSLATLRHHMQDICWLEGLISQLPWCRSIRNSVGKNKTHGPDSPRPTSVLQRSECQRLPSIFYSILSNSKMLSLSCFEWCHVTEPDKKCSMHIITLFTLRCYWGCHLLWYCVCPMGRNLSLFLTQLCFSWLPGLFRSQSLYIV